MKQVPLKAAAKFINGRAFKPSDWQTEGLPIVRIQNLTKSSSVTNYFSGEVDPKYIIHNGDILISWSASLGVYRWDGDTAILNQHIFKAVLKENVDSTYFYYAATSVLEDMKSQVHGTTMQHITKEPFESTLIPLPHPDEQKRIAGILAKADRLRRLRRFALEMSSDYLQAVFLEMFGDPITNPMGWKKERLGTHLSRIDSGWSPVCDEQRNSSSQWAILKLGAVTWGTYDPQENKQLPTNIKPRPNLEVKAGDLLFSRKNTIDLVGACALVHLTPPKLMLPDTIFRFVFKSTQEIAPEYAWMLFNNIAFKKNVQLLATGSAGSMPNISKEKVKGITVPLPPPSLQQQFAQIVGQYERLRTQQREALRQAEHLFQTLLHQAFAGELQ